MDASDPVSCLLCLSAYERSTMLRIHLRAIASDSTSVYYFCQKCGGAIAAEYLYVQNSGKPETTIEVESRPSGKTDNGELVEVDELGRHIPIAAEAAATAGVGEEKTVGAPKGTPKGNRKG